MFKLDNIAGGIGELDFFDKIGYAWVFELDNIEFVWVFELDNITRGIGELEFFDKIGIV
jgi:hypothetical protein